MLDQTIRECTLMKNAQQYESISLDLNITIDLCTQLIQLIDFRTQMICLYIDMREPAVKSNLTAVTHTQIHNNELILKRLNEIEIKFSNYKTSHVHTMLENLKSLFA
jgi:hypothetical protein